MEQISRMLSFLRRVIEWIFLGIVAGIAILFISLYVQGTPKLIPYVILSGSMSPAIPAGAVVFVKPQPIYSPDDIVTFTDQPGKNKFVTHRIVAIDQTSYTTKGDANKTPDSRTIQIADIQGKVIMMMPYVGYIVQFIKTPHGFLFLIVIPATIVVYEELKALRKELTAGLARLVKRHHTGPNKRTIPLPVIFLILPIVTSLSIGVLRSGSFLKDAENSIGSIIGASASFGSSTPTATPTIPLDLTPTPEGTSSADTL